MCHLAAGERAGRPHRLLRPSRSAQQLWPGAGYLICIQILAQVRFIYQVAFPDRPQWQAETYQATNCGVRHALIALCLRFADYLFPLAFSLEWLQQIDVIRNFDAGELAAIPIAPRGVDVLGDPYFYGPDAFEPPYDFFAWGLIQEVYRGEVEDEACLPPYHLPFPLPRTWSLTRTAHLMRQARLPEPLNYLAIVAEYIAGSTGNPWLDHEIDNYYEYLYEEDPIEWTPENVSRLKQQYDEALELERQMEAIETWVAADPHNRMKAILALIQILYANEHLNQFPERLARLWPGSPSVTWPGYRLDDLIQAEPILTAVQLWDELFNEPFPDISITLNQHGTAVVITRLLANLWNTRYPLWQDEARLLQVSGLIHHLQNSDDGNLEAAMTPLQVDCLRVYLTLGQRYAELFPDNTTWPTGITGLDEDSLSTAVSDFLSAVDRDYFPVDDELWVEDIEYLAGRLEYIDLIPQGHELNLDFTDDLDEFEEPLRTLLALVREEETTDLPDIELYGLSEVIAGLPLPQPICDNLPALVQLVSHSTGNAWLDWSYGDLAQGGISLPEWCADNVAFLKEEWAAAQSFLAQEKALIQWVNADRPTHLAAVRGALSLAYVYSKKESVMKLDHVILTIYPEATLLEKVLEDGSRIIHPISPADLAGQLNQIPLSTGLLPHNTLFWGQEGGQEQIAIYVPPRQWRTIAYDRHYRLPMPGMIFLGQGRQYTVFAVKQKPKTPETPLCHLPVPNVDGNGRICLGQAPFPTAGRKSIYSALKLFMEGSRFNHDNSRQRCLSFPDNTLELWARLDGQKRFPLDELVSARKQLKQLMG